MANIARNQTVHEGRLERWLGAERMERQRALMVHGGGPGKAWYGPPIALLDVPGSVKVHSDGGFTGRFQRGVFFSAADAFAEHAKRYIRSLSVPRPAMAGVGFASLSDALLRSSSGYKHMLNGNLILKSGPTGVVGVTSSLWRVGSAPAAGGAPAAAPGGTAFTSATTGAMVYTNPAAGTLHLTSACMAASVINNTLLLYDRIFGVVKTMNSTGTEAVTGVPSRYQSATALNPDYAGGNFLAIEIGGTVLAATAHNWTVCLYTDQDGNTGATLPTVTGNSAGIVDRLDQPAQTWFCPLASGDNGIKALTQMQCSAAVATGVIWFAIGHPIGWMNFPVINSALPFDWLTSIDQAPRIFDSACLALYEVTKPATTATTYTGCVSATSAAA